MTEYRVLWLTITILLTADVDCNHGNKQQVQHGGDPDTNYGVYQPIINIEMPDRDSKSCDHEQIALDELKDRFTVQEMKINQILDILQDRLCLCSPPGETVSKPPDTVQHYDDTQPLTVELGTFETTSTALIGYNDVISSSDYPIDYNDYRSPIIEEEPHLNFTNMNSTNENVTNEAFLELPSVDASTTSGTQEQQPTIEVSMSPGTLNLTSATGANGIFNGSLPSLDSFNGTEESINTNRSNDNSFDEYLFDKSSEYSSDYETSTSDVLFNDTVSSPSNNNATFNNSSIKHNETMFNSSNLYNNSEASTQKISVPTTPTISGIDDQDNATSVPHYVDDNSLSSSYSSYSISSSFSSYDVDYSSESVIESRPDDNSSLPIQSMNTTMTGNKTALPVLPTPIAQTLTTSLNNYTTNSTESNLNSEFNATLSEFDNTESKSKFNDSNSTEVNFDANDTKAGLNATLPSLNTNNSELNVTLPTTLNTSNSEFNASLPSINATNAEFNATLPGVNTTNSEFNASLPGKNTTNSESNTTLPSVSTTNSESNTTLPSVNTTNSESNTTLPSVNTTNSESNTTLPSVNTTSSEFNSTLPSLSTTNSVFDAIEPRFNITDFDGSVADIDATNHLNESNYYGNSFSNNNTDRFLTNSTELEITPNATFSGPNTSVAKNSSNEFIFGNDTLFTNQTNQPTDNATKSQNASDNSSTHNSLAESILELMKTYNGSNINRNLNLNPGNISSQFNQSVQSNDSQITDNEQSESSASYSSYSYYSDSFYESDYSSNMSDTNASLPTAMKNNSNITQLNNQGNTTDTVILTDSVSQVQNATVARLNSTGSGLNASTEQPHWFNNEPEFSSTYIEEPSYIDNNDDDFEDYDGSECRPASKLRDPPKDCDDVAMKMTDEPKSGEYCVYPSDGQGAIRVFCDLEDDSGGWMVIQRHERGFSFARTWQEYSDGFGDISEDFWLGNDNIHRLSSQDDYELRIDIADYYGKTAYAKYDEFRIGDEMSQYELTVGRYSGNAGDSMRWHNHHPFSTWDEDHDVYQSGNCAQIYQSGWWFTSCLSSNLNGMRLPASTRSMGIVWTRFEKGANLASSSMMIRRVNVQRSTHFAVKRLGPERFGGRKGGGVENVQSTKGEPGQSEDEEEQIDLKAKTKKNKLQKLFKNFYTKWKR